MAAPQVDLTGKTVGEYEIIRQVGVGGMGVVYEGRHPLIGKRVAVKVLLPQLSQEQDLVDRFVAEARAVNEIRHRGIVDIFSFGQLPEGSWYFVMEFLEGEPFDRLIKTRAPLAIGEALALTEEVLDGLDAAHQAGIIHRDIKPSNLFLVDTGRGKPYVKLLDFGIAKLGVLQGEATPQTRASMLVGTPDYMSPEQARGQAISPATDVYAMGCVLYELLTRKRLFRGENSLRTMWMHVEDAPPLARAANPLVPPEVDDALQWALRKNAPDRPASAAEFKAHLEALRLALPAELQAPSLTPAPISGRTRPITIPPRAAPLPAETRASAPDARPVRAKTPAPARAPAPSRVADPAAARPKTPSPARDPEPDSPVVDLAGPDEVPVKGLPRGALVGVAVVGLAIIGAGVAFLLGEDKKGEALPEVPAALLAPPSVAPGTPTTPPGAAPSVPVVKSPEGPVQPAAPPVEAAPAVVVDAGLAVAVPDAGLPVAPVEAARPPVPVGPRAPSTAQLEGRLAKLQVKLEAREAATGEKDRVLRPFIEQARAAVAAARTDAERREAAGFLDELAAQLGR